jgi:perosamine synthetase
LKIEIFRYEVFSFIQNTPKLEDIKYSKTFIHNQNEDCLIEYEKLYASEIGKGEALAFASARMAFYSLMKHLRIGTGDEVIIPAFTCSVMINAIIKTGATPIFCDIDRETFGTDPESVKKVISEKTKMVIAQHTFGYPCEVDKIKLVAQQAQAFVLEDCALSLGTIYKGTSLGDLADAAIFSTDHAKPINTLIGGVLYSKNKNLMKDLRAKQSSLPNLSISKQKAIWRRLKLESKFNNSKSQRVIRILDLVAPILYKLSKRERAFLDGDNNPKTDITTYPYPARFPQFLAYIGIQQLKAWSYVKDERKKNLSNLLSVLLNFESLPVFPRTVIELKDSIVPLRLAWIDLQKGNLNKKLSSFLAIEQFWFRKPIIGSNFELVEFGYFPGSCPVAEEISRSIINLPILDNQRQAQRLIDRIEELYSKVD